MILWSSFISLFGYAIISPLTIIAESDSGEHFYQYVERLTLHHFTVG